MNNFFLCDRNLGDKICRGGGCGRNDILFLFDNFLERKRYIKEPKKNKKKNQKGKKKGQKDYNFPIATPLLPPLSPSSPSPSPTTPPSNTLEKKIKLPIS